MSNKKRKNTIVIHYLYGWIMPGIMGFLMKIHYEIYD